jgi:hypothetical protein
MVVPSSTNCRSRSAACRSHVRNGFELTVRAPYKVAASLFGPNGERSWVGDEWNPEFIYPCPAADIEGTIFTIKHGPHQAVWVNTAFDLKGGHIQYVYFINDVMVTTIDVTFRPLDSASTKVSVVYKRTALNAEADDDVQKLGVTDRSRGADWEKAINSYLEHR